ncbi:hypothetical protein [Bradyrhizobium sp. SZCCHNRI2049]|uniref:hypothetical protein n=1 Tax=Bradyrhizobium sp. SZCCHNRI2049 TaxID=3057287 RepID=UPI002916C125|nr:hypothetical protein [Bradyrhizobium sp. SZCCHNRI2049]
MARPPLDLPPAVARAFMADLAAYRAAATGFDKDAIAARQLRALREHLRPSDGRLRLTDVRELFEAMREHANMTTPARRASTRRSSKR